MFEKEERKKVMTYEDKATALTKLITSMAQDDLLETLNRVDQIHSEVAKWYVDYLLAKCALKGEK